MRRTTYRTNLKTGETTVTTTYGITGLSPEQADAAQLERLWRGHWTIENRVHYGRDVAMGEDAGQTRTGRIPRTLALFRCLVLTLLRLAGWPSIPNAFRHYRTSLKASLQLLGLLPAPPLTLKRPCDHGGGADLTRKGSSYILTLRSQLNGLKFMKSGIGRLEST